MCQRTRSRPASLTAADIAGRLDRIEDVLKTLAGQRLGKDWFSTAEAAGLLGRAEFTANMKS